MYFSASIIDVEYTALTATSINNVDLTVSDFYLEQNYPNPFNSTTLINYQIPVNSNVELKVYDILGREIVTLVNEDKHAGNYKVEFNSNTLPSGIYFYRLQAGTFSETKKLILMR